MTKVAVPRAGVRVRHSDVVPVRDDGAGRSEVALAVRRPLSDEAEDRSPDGADDHRGEGHGDPLGPDHEER